MRIMSLLSDTKTVRGAEVLKWRIPSIQSGSPCIAEAFLTRELLVYRLISRISKLTF